MVNETPGFLRELPLSNQFIIQNLLSFENCFQNNFYLPIYSSLLVTKKQNKLIQELGITTNTSCQAYVTISMDFILWNFYYNYLWVEKEITELFKSKCNFVYLISENYELSQNIVFIVLRTETEYDFFFILAHVSSKLKKKGSNSYYFAVCTKIFWEAVTHVA